MPWPDGAPAPWRCTELETLLVTHQAQEAALAAEAQRAAVPDLAPAAEDGADGTPAPTPETEAATGKARTRKAGKRKAGKRKAWDLRRLFR